MSVTMVSNHVHALEDRLGARLLNRTTRKVSLTEIGQAYYERATRVLADLEEADSLAGALHATPRGTLRLHTSNNIVRFLTSVLAEFLTLYPAAAVDLTVGEGLVDIIEDGYDLVIRPIPSPDSRLIVRRLTPWRHILCCAPSYLESHPAPTRPTDLVNHNCLRYALYPFGDEWRFGGPAKRPVSVRVAGDIITNSGEMLRALALSGRGVFLAASFLVADDIAAGTLVRLMPD